jgi:hypothetical protein
LISIAKNKGVCAIIVAEKGGIYTPKTPPNANGISMDIAASIAPADNSFVFIFKIIPP